MTLTERNFRPRLGQGELPDLTDYMTVSDRDFQRAAELWNARMPEAYQDLLYAEVVGDDDGVPLFAVIDKGDWRWLQRSYRYRNTRTKEVIGDAKWTDLRDDFTDALYPDVEEVSADLVDRTITVHEYLRRMARLIRLGHCASWLFGCGGYNRLRPEAVLSLEDTLRTQLSYLRSFGVDIINQNRTDRQGHDPLFGIALDVPRIPLRPPRPTPVPAATEIPTTPITDRGLVNRGVMYVEAMTASAEKARSTTYHPHPDILPNYPGDGSTLCLSRCRCHWQFIFPRGQDSFYHAYWRLRGHHPDGKNCATCLEYNRRYNPYTVTRF